VAGNILTGYKDEGEAKIARPNGNGSHAGYSRNATDFPEFGAASVRRKRTNKDQSKEARMAYCTTAGTRSTTGGYLLEDRRNPMPDDKSEVGESDRSKVAKDQDYEFSYLVHELRISSEEARKLIYRFGGNREKLYAAAETLKQGRQT
jgi:hypothetical protein